MEEYIKVGISLFSRGAATQVFSAPLSLTSVFGMGTGVPSTLAIPTILTKIITIQSILTASKALLR